MNKTFLWNAYLNSPQFLSAPAAARGHWVCLQRHCSEQESSGVVRGARAFSSVQWTMVLGAGGGIRAIQRIVDAGLAEWSDQDLIVAGYHLDSEKSYQERRTHGSAGGKAKAEKDRKARDRRELSGLKSGGGTASATSSATGFAIPNKESRGSDSWGERSQVEESERGDSKVFVPATPDQLVEVFRELHQRCLGTPYQATSVQTMDARIRWKDLEPTELPERITTYLRSRGVRAPSITEFLDWTLGTQARERGAR